MDDVVMGKPHKYKVASKERRTIDGITFDSMAEMNRYLELKMLEKSGVISSLELQPKFLLIPKLKKAGGQYTTTPTLNIPKMAKPYTKM